jgi:hypothetical protein
VPSATPTSSATPAPPEQDQRVTEGLQALYTFEKNENDDHTILDVSGNDHPLNLNIKKESRAAISWEEDGALVITGSTIIKSSVPVTRLVEAARQSNELTIEAWISPAPDPASPAVPRRQDGPARIVTLSADPLSRNFTLGQGPWEEGEAGTPSNQGTSNFYDIRLRTNDTGRNGVPSLRTGSVVTTTRQHVVYTRHADGTVHIYIDGQEQDFTEYDGHTERAAAPRPGTFEDWDDQYHLALANELTEDRPWLGTYHLVAIYSRALSEAEVTQNYEATTSQ